MRKITVTLSIEPDILKRQTNEEILSAINFQFKIAKKDLISLLKKRGLLK